MQQPHAYHIAHRNGKGLIHRRVLGNVTDAAMRLFATGAEQRYAPRGGLFQTED
jgi:hypothetical protein